MRAMLADYAIPKNKMQAARARDSKYHSTGAVIQLHHEALNLFTHLAQTGEGGEMLLYLLSERFLKMPQVLCKWISRLIPLCTITDLMVCTLA